MTQISGVEQQIDSMKLRQLNFESAAFSATKWIQKGVDLFESAKRFESKIHEVWGYFRAAYETLGGKKK
jgi:hypothetical protein